MEGWVSKKRPTGVGKFKMWQKRFLVCNSEHLSYFGENERKKPKAQFRLNEIESVSLVVSEKKPDHTRFDIVCRPVVVGSVKGASEKETMKRVYSFRATTSDDAKKWVSTINSLAFGESIDVNGDIIDLTKPDILGLRGEDLTPRLAATSAPIEAANLREVICDRIYNALNISAILSPSAALTLDADGTRGSVKPTFLSSGGYLCSNENNTEEHLKMMIYNELGSDTDLLRFLCGQFYTLICSGNRDGFDSRSRAHSFSASVSQTATEASSPPPSSPTLRSPVVKCALKTCKNMRCRLPGFLGFRAALEPRPGAPQQLFCTEHAELWARASQACAKSLQTPLLGELLEQPPDVLVHELITALANGTPDAKGVACRLLWVVLPVYLEHKAKHKRRAHDKAKRDERSGSEPPSASDVNQDEYENSDSTNLPRLSISIQNSTHHQRRLSATSEHRLSTSTLSPLPPSSPRATDMAALEETSVVRTVALKTLPKQFAALMSQHCSGQEYSLPIKNALTSIMLRPSARMLKPEDLDLEEQAAMHMVVNHDGACWLAFMVALKCAPFNLREQALKEVNMLLIENPGNCSNFKRQRNWPWLIYSLMSDIPASILGQQTAEEHEELTKQRESGLLSNVLPVGRDFPSLSFSLSSNSDDSNPPTPQPRSPLAPLPLTASPSAAAMLGPSLSSSSSTPTINPPHNPSVIAPPVPVAETPTPPHKQPPPPPPPPLSSSSQTSSSSSNSSSSNNDVEDGGGSKKNSLKFSFEQQPQLEHQPKRGSLTKVKLLPSLSLPPLAPNTPSPTTPNTTPTTTSSSSSTTTAIDKPRRRLSQPDEIPAAVTHENGTLQPKRGSLKKRPDEDSNNSNSNGNGHSYPPAPPALPSLSISITDLTPLSLRLTPDDPDVDQIDPELIAATQAAVCAEEAKSPKGGGAAPCISVNINSVNNSDHNKMMLNNNNNNRRKGAVFVHKGAGGTLPFRNNNSRGTSPSRYGTLTGAFAIHRKGEEKNEAEEHNKLIVRVYTYSLNIMTILQYDSAIHSSSIHFRQLMLRCLNALLSCTKEDKARTLMRTMFITLSTKLGSKKILDRNQLNSLVWQNLFPFFDLIRIFLFQTFTFNILEEAKIRGISHDRKKTMLKKEPSPMSLISSSSSSSSSSTSSSLSLLSSSSRPLPAPFAAWGHEEGYMVDLLPGVDVMADSETRRVSTAGGELTGVDDAVFGFENGEYGFHLDAPGYYGDIALAERCAYLLRCKGVDTPVDESLPGVTSKDIAILREAYGWYEFFEDAVELLKLLPAPTPAEKGDVKAMSDRLALFDNIMDGKTLKKFCEAPKEARRTMLKKIKEGPKPSRNPFATPRRSQNKIVIDLSGGGPKSPTAAK